MVTSAGTLKRRAMASPRVMAPASSANSDLARQAPSHPAGHPVELAGDRARSGLGSLNVEELLRHFYADSAAGSAAPAAEISPDPGAPGEEEEGEGVGNAGVEGRKKVEEVWKGVSGDRGVNGAGETVYKEVGLGEVTLEAFLAREAAVAEEDVRAAPGEVLQHVDASILGFVVDPALGDRFVQQQQHQQLLQADGLHARSGNGAEGGKRRTLQDPLDKASQQKQRRMIKNRESAARSRERKQAYTADLEKLVSKLEEENARLVRRQEVQNKARLKQVLSAVPPTLRADHESVVIGRFSLETLADFYTMF